MPITDDGDLSYIVIATPIIHDEGKLLIGSRKNSGRAILSLNAGDGSVNWQWNDLLSLLSDPAYKDPITLVVESYYINNGKLFFTYRKFLLP
jgi:outer membrane protein assembly factor BamB